MWRICDGGWKKVLKGDVCWQQFEKYQTEVYPAQPAKATGSARPSSS